MTIYDELQVVAQDVMKEFNQGVIKYVKITPGNGPVDDPGEPTVTEYTLTGAAANGVSFKYVQNGMAVASDLQVITSVDPRFTPDKSGGDMVKVDELPYKIVQIIPKPAAGTPVANLLIIRRGS